MDGAEIERITFGHVPEPVWRDLLKMTYTAHRDAHTRITQEFAPPEHQPMMGIERRARVEQGMRAVGDKHGISYRIERQTKGGPWQHTELVSGPVVVTSAAVQYPLDKIDPSEYRLTLARSADLPLPGFEKPLPPDAGLYAVLLHSRACFPSPQEQRDYGFLPGSAYIVYPNAELDFYVHSVNLFDQFPDVVKSMTPQEWDSDILRLYIERSRPIYTPRRFG